MLDEFASALEIYKALGDGTRFRIFYALAKSSEHMPGKALAAQLKLSQPTVSQHLKILKTAGIAKAYRKGREINYFIDRELIRDIMQRVINLTQAPATPPLPHLEELAGWAQQPEVPLLSVPTH